MDVPLKLILSTPLTLKSTIRYRSLILDGFEKSTHIPDDSEIFRKVFWVTMDFYDNNPGVAVTAFITVPMRTWMQDGSYKKQYDLAILKQHIDLARNKGEIDPDISFRQIIDAYYMVCYRYIHNWYYAGMNYRVTEKLDEYFKLFWKIMMPVTG